MEGTPNHQSAEHTLLLRLAGPMQSWGFRSRFDNRDTALEPTRSGVIGLLCAALGWEREADLTPFAALRMGVRVDAPGRVMVDYQTAQDVLKASGGIAATTQSWRSYLADARFLVGLCGPDLNWLRELEGALLAPVFPIFLGRKSYVPSVPIVLPGGSVRENMGLQAALSHEPWRCIPRERWLLSRSRTPVKLRLLVENLDAERGVTSNDVPFDFARRRFGLRTVERLESIVVNESLCLEDELCLTSTYRG